MSRRLAEAPDADLERALLELGRSLPIPAERDLAEPVGARLRAEGPSRPAVVRLPVALRPARTLRRAAVLAAPVPLRDREVVLERGVRLLERVLELVALEDVVDGARRLAVPLLRVDDPADRPDRARLALDPDQDPLLVPRVVDAVEDPLGESAPVGRNRHEPTIQSLLWRGWRASCGTRLRSSSHAARRRSRSWRT